MGLLNFLLGTSKQAKTNVQQAKCHAYNQGYHDGYHDSYEAYVCECEDGTDDCRYDYESEELSDDYECECGYDNHGCCGEDNSDENWY